LYPNAIVNGKHFFNIRQNGLVNSNVIAIDTKNSQGEKSLWLLFCFCIYVWQRRTKPCGHHNRMAIAAFLQDILYYVEST